MIILRQRILIHPPPYRMSMYYIYIVVCTNIQGVYYIYMSMYYIYIRTQNHFNKMKKEVGMLLPKSTDTRGVGISSMRKSI